MGLGAKGEEIGVDADALNGEEAHLIITTLQANWPGNPTPPLLWVTNREEKNDMSGTGVERRAVYQNLGRGRRAGREKREKLIFVCVWETFPGVFVFHIEGAEDDEKEGASGIEKLTTEEVGSCDLDQGEEVLGRRRAAQDLGGAFVTGLAGGGVGVEVAALGMDAAVGKEAEGTSSFVLGLHAARCWRTRATPGFVVGHAGVISATADDGTSDASGEGWGFISVAATRGS
ncbi:hypothetical protein FIBSPDRAFT_1044217 [Athelia psychrophila]|uniref:Uncharacterized protein n=1 Tax=Athelia psychrophila TaxID=1759441 RepID=A0A166JVG8_9AGAM|nr:hypothetical protein FIBSPDRAFT_1044217 [Fibularhizoctonia sp. CBS 109695]